LSTPAPQPFTGRRASLARPAAVRRKVEQWLAEPDGAEVMALRARPEWDGDPVIAVGDVTVRVVGCHTPLAVRAALYERPEGERLVLLIELSEDELGDSVLARLSKQQVRSIDRWDLLRQVFRGAPYVDPALVRAGRWAADALVDHAPPQGWPAPPGTVVTRDHALRHLASHLLGLDREQIDSAGLLQWTTDAAGLMRFTNLPDETVDGLTAHLAELAGASTHPIMAAVRAGHGIDVVPLGLLVGVLWPTGGGAAGSGTGDTVGPGTARRVDTDIAVARARLEPWFGGKRLTDPQACAFREAADAWIGRALETGDAEARRMLERAEAIAAQLEMTRLLGASRVLPTGLTQRVRRFAEALRIAVPAGAIADQAAVARAQEALAAVEEHRAAARDRIETARMAVRLLRWLATEDGPAAATLYDAVHRHVHHDGWVDRARLDIFAGDPAADPALAEAYRRLHQAVEARRARHDERFATLLGEATAGEAEPGALLRVEDVLERVVRPILERGRRVLLLVLDGMGVAAAAELAESVADSRPWVELSPGGGPRTGVLAALPTVTEVSRCSLLSGRIAVGGQADERAGFGKLFPYGVLLHKASLRAGAGEALDPHVRAALDDPARPLVAAVVNTIDDALDRSEPGTAVWDTTALRAVAQLLARAQERVVVVLSDHGHVVDRGADAVIRSSPSSENRWRPATDPPGDGEVLVTGSRVGIGDGSVVLPWREQLRYGPRKAGYHGGASPAEAVIPLLVFTTGDEGAVPGWSGAPVASPPWWREALPQTRPVTPTADGRMKGPRRAAPQGASLFDLPVPEPAQEPSAAPPPPQRVRQPAAAQPAAARQSAGKPEPPLVAALLASGVYAQRRDTRAPLSDERVAALLAVLLDGGGRATMETLAARAGVPAHRIAGTVTALRRLLQVEGYPVIEIDPDGRTVKLDEALLREQFGLDR
jgi:hypothetical protein